MTDVEVQQRIETMAYLSKEMQGVVEEAAWKRDVLELLEHVITADQRMDHNNTMQDTRRDGPLAAQARRLISRAP